MNLSTMRRVTLMAGLSLAMPLWAADPCVPPGPTLVTDPAGDHTGAELGNNHFDIRSVSVAELGTAPGTRKLVFTLKMEDLATLPINGSYQVFFDTTIGETTTPSRYVEMTTDETGAVTFSYGKPDATTGALTPEGAADPESTYGADGTIRLVLSVGKIGNPPPGSTLGNVNANARMLGGPSMVGGVYINFDDTSSANYRLTAAGTCPPLETEDEETNGSVVAGGPRFTVYNPPRDRFRDGIFTADEPTLGINYKTGSVFMVYSLNILRTQFDHSHSPARATWEDVTSGLTASTADPFLTMGTPYAANGRPDPAATGRVFEVQLNAANSSISYSDDDGATWLPSQGGGQPHGADNQSTASGPYPVGRKPVTALANYALYYCSHAVVNAFCSRSDDGGVTWNPSRAIFPLGCSNHGHVKVGADGTVYVPMNNSCDGAEGVSVSVDAGETWHYLTVPNTSNGRWDSSIAIAADGKTVYYGYGEQGSDRPMIIKGTLNKSDPANPRIDWDAAGAVDVGTPANLRNMVFATVVAGDPDRAAMIFHGTTTPGDSGDPTAMGASGNSPAEWHLYAATTYDGGRNWALRDITPNDPTQRGAICDHGTACTTEDRPPDRNLLDFMGAVIDARGRIVIGFADGCTEGCALLGGAPNYADRGGLAVQTGGKRMYAEFDSEVPAQPLSPWLQATRGPLGATLDWEHPDQGDAPILGYRIYRKVNNGAETLLDEVGFQTQYLDGGARNAGDSYSYRIAAFNSRGEGAKSNAATAAAGAVQDPCTLPGVTALTDPAGDATGPNAAIPGLPQTDLTAVSLAEPRDLGGKLVITLKVDNLSTVPAGHRWVAYFNKPDGSVFFAAMLTSNSAMPEFVYGTTVTDDSNPVAAFRLYEVQGNLDPASNYAADGTITLVIDKSTFGSPAPGFLLDKLFAQTRSSAPDAGDGRGLTTDNTGESSYRLRSANACDVGPVNTPPVAALQATPTAGAAPLTVQFDAGGSSDADGDAIVEYRFVYGDGSSETLTTPTSSHTYTSNGTYGASVTVKDARGALSSNVPNAQIVVGAVSGDADGDGVGDGTDNCVNVANANQTDTDGDGAGDACDTVNNADSDGDGVANATDNCPTTANADQRDSDGDGAGDVCDSVNNADPDGDGIVNAQDNCPNVANANQADSDGDGIGNACDTTNTTDGDGDGVVNGSDNCPTAPNPAQTDTDGDGAGDVCDSVNNSDNDGDGVANATDNCPAAPNPSQTDTDGDGAGDVCDSVNNTDQDGDGIVAAEDNCPTTANPQQQDIDGDGVGDACDTVNDLDDDGDGVADGEDNCPAVPNPNQADGDGDGVGNACDATFNDDTDGDTILNGSDNCPAVPNTSQSNVDGDGFGDACDADQGKGGGTAKVNRASNGTIEAQPGDGLRVGDLLLRNTSNADHVVQSIRLRLDRPQNLARIWAVTPAGLRFDCSPAAPGASNVCTAATPVPLKAGQSLKLEVWVELTPAAKGAQTLAALATGSGGLMLIGSLGLGLGRRRLGTAALLAATLALGACSGGDGPFAATPPADAAKVTSVTLDSVEIRDNSNAPVDYGLNEAGVEVGRVTAK